MRRDDICLYLCPDDCAALQALVRNRNAPRKLVWRAEIILATADGHGTFEVMPQLPEATARARTVMGVVF